MSLDCVGVGGGERALVEAVRGFAESSSGDRGAVFTRREVVEFILDLTGYTEDRDLASARLLEPSSGHGDFLVPAVRRLLTSYAGRGGDLASAAKDLSGAMSAFEVHVESLEAARAAVAAELIRMGVPKKASGQLARAWIKGGDFLLAPIPEQFTHVVGNPPYVRQELIPEALLATYRERFRTMYDRADLYVPFFERCLSLLSEGGRLGFICTDRWTKNKYGGPLRELISKEYHLSHYVDLIDTRAFNADVITYPAITVIERCSPRGVTRVAYRPDISSQTLKSLATALTRESELAPPSVPEVVELTGVVRGPEPWIVHRPDRLTLVRRLESSLPTMEEVGCKVGIGVATGADGIYIQKYSTLDVEPSRKLRLVRTQDILKGHVEWQGMGVLNPFGGDGRIVDLEKYPRFKRYLEGHERAIKARNVAKKNRANWYRTIDRIYPALAKQPKLLIPDIKGNAHVVYEDGKLYPHHNLYYVTSQEWDLRALQAVLLSGIARLFVATYSTSMRGGYLRFQAQYLRRIRLPRWSSVPQRLRGELRAAAEAGDRNAANRATFELYGLTPAEQAIVAEA